MKLLVKLGAEAEDEAGTAEIADGCDLNKVPVNTPEAFELPFKLPFQKDACFPVVSVEKAAAAERGSPAADKRRCNKRVVMEYSITRDTVLVCDDEWMNEKSEVLCGAVRCDYTVGEQLALSAVYVYGTYEEEETASVQL